MWVGTAHIRKIGKEKNAKPPEFVRLKFAVHVAGDPGVMGSLEIDFRSRSVNSHEILATSIATNTLV